MNQARLVVRLALSSLALAACRDDATGRISSARAESVRRHCQLLVVGGSTAAFSATIAAARLGAQVCLAAPTKQLGGQFTSQALSASDDGQLAQLAPAPGRVAGERFAFSALQERFRRRERALQPLNGAVIGNPGRCWVGDLCTRPDVAQQAFDELLQPYLDSGNVLLFSQVAPTALLTTASANGRRQVSGASFVAADGSAFDLGADIVVEATELGDLLDLGGIESVVGQEARAQTGETVLPDTACPDCQQSFTYDIVVERTAGLAPQQIAAPIGYGVDAWLSGYTSTYWHGSDDAGWKSRSFFDNFSIFDYRRAQALSSSGGAAGDVAILNWGCQQQGASGQQACGNDYRGGTLTGVDRTERERQLARARARAVGYLHYLQGNGASNLEPRGDLTGTTDGVASAPYIREARRGLTMRTIVHADLAASAWPGNCTVWPATDPLAHAQCRGLAYGDSVGIGQYHYFDIHGNDAPGQVALAADERTALPYTIPLGALIPVATDGLILSAKSIGTTHITNAAYRLHPTEWAIGEASGTAAAWAALHNVAVRDLLLPLHVAQLQSTLASTGVPLYWFDDVAVDDADFAAIQLLAAAQLVIGDSLDELHFLPEEAVSRALACDALVKTLGLPLSLPAAPTFNDVPPSHWAYATIETAVKAGIVHGYGDGRFGPSDVLLRQQLGFMVANGDGALAQSAFASVPRDQQPAAKRELARVLAVLYRARLGL